ncbi:MAG: hypothetical protein Q9168_005493 [Polycauliona sp. 1 TL-2023]
MGNGTYFHAFEDSVKTESDAALEQIGSYAGPLPFMGDSHLRPDGFGLLDTMLMPMASPKYSHFNGGMEGSSYVGDPLLFVWLPSCGLLASSWASHIKLPVSSVPMTAFPRLTPNCLGSGLGGCLVAASTVLPLARFWDLGHFFNRTRIV